jgi:hypothetical protein
MSPLSQEQELHPSLHVHELPLGWTVPLSLQLARHATKVVPTWPSVQEQVLHPSLHVHVVPFAWTVPLYVHAIVPASVHIRWVDVTTPLLHVDVLHPSLAAHASPFACATPLSVQSTLASTWSPDEHSTRAPAASDPTRIQDRQSPRFDFIATSRSAVRPRAAKPGALSPLIASELPTGGRPVGKSDLLDGHRGTHHTPYAGPRVG